MKKTVVVLTVAGTLFLGIIGHKDLTRAEWSVQGESTIFYTDDVGLFSSSRRLSLQEDPTQPVIEITGQGEDVVLEPIITAAKGWRNSWGETAVSFRGQGFLFFDQSDFSHATYGLKVEHTLPSYTTFSLCYHYGPNLFLGKNEERRSGSRQVVDERVTTNFFLGIAEQDFGPDISVRLLSRYGNRTYQESFSQRDTDFWTIGSHLDWTMVRGVDFTLGYHYERGLADGRHQPQFMDDVSYINHYVSSELGIDLCDNATLELALHYEQNSFTSTLTGDKRQGAGEEVWQGDLEVQYHVNEKSSLNVGFQRSQRKASFVSQPRLLM